MKQSQTSVNDRARKRGAIFADRAAQRAVRSRIFLHVREPRKRACRHFPIAGRVKFVACNFDRFAGSPFLRLCHPRHTIRKDS
ncbi:hypothetical protein WT27_30790 [Burkholderia territorii]|uniref:Uncharacterized protein n=1 Tax=Burkholderia territorii TaxID=1503055 RepID=A0A119DQW2_9BURK|nr:hypothetical protein WT27_30790 [Burkholderia territorii]KVX42970.1 hypothetical protein WT31_27950 [Burkholderia territorii]